MRALSFRARLAVTMSVLILVICAAIWIYVPRKIEEEAMALIAHKAETLAQLTAFTIHPSIHFQDRAALEEALSGTRQDKDVSYVIVNDPAGNTLASFHPERASGGAQYTVTTPIVDEEKEIARLHIGVSLARLNREIFEARVAIGILTAIILAAGLLAVFLISDVMTRPLRQLATAAQRIAAGDLDQRVAAGRGDEIGLLADAFNDMASKIAERDASLRLLSRRLLSIQEEERIRIAREVHDELGQALTAMKIDVQHLGLTAIGRTIDQIVDLVRRIATDLRPAILDDLGITAALEQQLRRLRETTELKTTLTVTEEPQLDMLTGATLYRIAQEALANVVRHAEATGVEVTLAVRDGAAVLEITDNGRGMSQDQISGARSLGLIGMRERAELLGGTVAIDSAPGEGTTLKATLPLRKDDHLASAVRR
jgi:signal transduction histidine kinase